MTPRPAYWAGTTIRSHRAPAAGEHRATSRRSPLKPILLSVWGGGALAALLLLLVVGFHGPAGSWNDPEPPAGKLFPLVPQVSSLPTEPAATGEGVGPGDQPRSSRGGTRGPLDPADPALPVDPSRPPSPAPTAAAAPTEAPGPLSTLMPTPGCPPPLPVDPPKGPKKTHPPRGPKVAVGPTPSVAPVP